MWERDLNINFSEREAGMGSGVISWVLGVLFKDLGSF